MILTLQPSDLDEYAKLPSKWRTQLDAVMRVLKQWSGGQLTKAEAQRTLGVSRATFDRKVAAVKDHGWRGLGPNYKGAVSLPDEVVSHWQKLIEQNQRKTAPAYRVLIRQWRERHPIPGYTGHPGWPNLPRGWDQRNLYRYQPTKLEMSALRHGLSRATSLHAPKVLSTRVGLWHLSHIVWDDVWLDVKTHLLTQRKPCRVLQIGALDLLSGSRFHYGQRPQLLRADGTRASLTESDMRFALASQLYTYGISPRGTKMVIEHGTAAIRDNVRDILTRGLGDLIGFDESGMTGKLQAIAGMYDGKGGGGNFRHKAALESLHNYMHNEFAALPGQTGHDRDEPEFLQVMEREHEWLHRIASRVNPQLLAKLRSPFLEYHSEFVPVAAEILKRINERTDHDLEGWAELGFLSRQYRLTPQSNDWMTEQQLLALPTPARQAMIAIAEADPRCLLPRKLSPAEVFQRGHSSAADVMRVPLPIIAEILYVDLARPARCDKGEFVIEDKEVAPGPMHFESRVMRSDGREEELTMGETYDLVINPYDPGIIAGKGSAFVYSATRQKGAFLGLAQRVHRHSRGDAEAATHAHARVAKRMSDLLTETRARHSGTTRQITERKAANLRVIQDYQAADADCTADAIADLATAREQFTNPVFDADDSW
jgi:hypothetical protein